MAVRLVAYDFNRERKGWNNDRDLLRTFLKDAWDWAYVSESAYAIETTMSAKAVYETLKPFLDSNDQLVVLTLSRPISGVADPEVADWLNSKV